MYENQCQEMDRDEDRTRAMGPLGTRALISRIHRDIPRMNETGDMTRMTLVGPHVCVYVKS